MANLALLRHSHSDMVGIGSALVVLEVAGHAGVRSEIEISPDVALITLQLGMTTREREADGIVIEIRRLPGAGGMALLASLGKAEGNVVGIACLLKIRQMAADARRRCALIPSTYVTGGAIQGGVHSGESEAGHFQMVEFRAEPGVNGVALLALHRQIRGDVVGGGSLLESVLMARVALDR